MGIGVRYQIYLVGFWRKNEIQRKMNKFKPLNC